MDLTCVSAACALPPTGWTRLPAAGLPLARIRAVALNADGHVFVAAQGVGVFRSVDGGSSFVKLGTPLTVNDPAVLNVISLGINALGEPVVGVAPPGTGTTATVVLRYSAAASSWITAAVSDPMSLGGYFPPAFRLDVDGSLLSSWPFRPDILRSVDGGSTWTVGHPIPNAAHVPPSGPSPTVKAVYGVASQPASGELFCGTEGDQWWRSTDRGATWRMVDEGGSSNLALEPGQNGFLVAFNKDGEPIFGTQGKADGNFLMRLTSDGRIVSSNAGFGAWAMVGTATMGTVLRELVLTAEGHNFLAMPVNDNAGGALPCDLWGSPDGAAWQALAAPFVPELNALAAVGRSVLVGGGGANPGVLWRYTPPLASTLPRVTTGHAPGAVVAAGLTGLTLRGSATDADGDALTFTWRARGPGPVVFGAPSALTTQVTFTAPGDHVLTLHASDGARSAGAPLIVRVSGG